MSNYTKSTNFATKDNLTPGDPLKVVRGTEIDTEYNNIATAIATKTDNASAAITGGSITGITDLAIADGGTGASTATAALNNLLPTQTGNANKYLQTDGTNATWDAVTLSTADITGTLPVANGGTGVTASTGTGSVVLSNSPTLVTPALGTPASGVATNLTGLPISTGVSGLGTGVATFLGTPSSANLISAVTDETGTGSLVFATSPTLVTPALGTPSALVGTNITGTASGLTAGNVTTNANLTGAVTSVGNATSLGSFSSANLLGALTDETGTGSAVFATSPTLVTPVLGTPTSATLTNATGLPISTGVSGLGTGIATALAVNVGSSGAPLVNGGVLGTPSSGTATNLTGLPLTTGVTGTLPVANGGTNLTSFTSGGVVYASSTSALATGSALTFNGTELGVGVTPIVGTPIAIQAGTGNTALRLVGTSSSGTSNAGIYWYDSNNTTFNGYIGNFSTGFDFYNQRNTPIVFYTNATELMRLTSRGLGIGTTSVTSKLTIGTDSFTSAASNTTGLYTGANGLVALSDGLILATRTGDARLTVDTSGNLGLGVTPSANSISKSLDLVNGAGLFGFDNGTYLTSNAYYNSAWKYKATATATLYYTNSGQHIWQTAASGTADANIAFTTAMTLDASGNLGVGLTNPTRKLEVTGNIGINSGVVLGERGTASAPAYSFTDDSNTGMFNISNLDLGFSTQGSERMRIDSSGNLLVGTTSQIGSTASRQVIKFDNNNFYGLALGGSASGAAGMLNFYNSAGTEQGYISTTGSGSTSYVTSSDYRLKENIAPMTGALAKVAQLKPVTYTWKENGSSGQGFIAHELQAIVPDCVTREKDAVDADGNPKYQGVDTSFLVATLTAAIQEQQAIIESLKARLDAANL